MKNRIPTVEELINGPYTLKFTKVLSKMTKYQPANEITFSAKAKIIGKSKGNYKLRTERTVEERGGDGYTIIVEGTLNKNLFIRGYREWKNNRFNYRSYPENKRYTSHITWMKA